jgi:hypothetical protein
MRVTVTDLSLVDARMGHHVSPSAQRRQANGHPKKDAALEITDGACRSRTFADNLTARLARVPIGLYRG